MEHDGYEFSKKLSDRRTGLQHPYTSNTYSPELDTSHACTEDQMTYYQNLIGVLRWIVELGRIDIAYEVSCLSRYLASPRTGHLVQALHIFKYLDIHSQNTLVFNPHKLHITNHADDTFDSKMQNMRRRVYPDASEEIPPNAPPPRGKSIQINCFVDASHADDRE